MNPVWLIESVVVLAAAVQVRRLAARPAFRREFVWKTGQKARWLWAAAAGAALAVGTVVWLPAVWHAGILGLAIFLAVAWWRARLGYGRRRGWPPGSLGIGHSLDALDNKRYYLEQAVRLGPVFKMSEYGFPVVCVVGLPRARTILTTHAASLGGADFWKPLERFIPRGPLRSMDARSHQEIAPLFRSAYRSLPLEQAEPEFRASWRRALARLAEDSAHGPRGVWPYVMRALLETVGSLLYGLGPDDPRLDDLGRWLPDLLKAPDRAPGWRSDTRAALDGIRAMMRDLQAGWHRAGEDTSVSALRALAAAQPGAIDDPTLAGNFVLISGIAYSDLCSLHVWMFRFLSEAPAVLAALRAAGARGGRAEAAQPDLPTRVVMETIRLERSVYLYRKAIRSFEFEGMVIPAGWTIRFCNAESHRDPEVFPDPERFDPDRFAGRTFGRDEYAPFGMDAHGCMGAHIAHFVGRLFVEELARGYEWRMVNEEPLSRGRWHRHHWHPNFQVVMTPRASQAPTTVVG